jgi:prepilin-type N-terminal cleavage/methylation domain-containing protein/prepilin-type processing-associated H-X9-DG protein
MHNPNTTQCPGTTKSDHLGFTLIELLVVIAIIAILAGLLLPTLTRAKQKAQGIECMSNIRQCTIAWLTYNTDFNGIFPYNEEGDIADPSPGRSPQGWIYAWEGYVGTGQPPDPGDGNTNPVYCLSAGYSQIGPYLQNVSVLHCPTDRSGNLAGGAGALRQRSYSMNQAIGANHNGDVGTTGSPTDPLQGEWLPYPTYQVYFKEGDVITPGPSKLWLLTDENADGINDGAFGLIMPSAGSSRWVDIPSKRHNNACAFTFVDGHAEIHKWRQPQNIPGELNGPKMNNPDFVTLAGANFGQGINLGADPDMYWLGWRTSYPTDTSAANVQALMNYPDPGP